MRPLHCLLLLPALLQGCATPPAPVPKIEGPSAVLIDSASGGGLGGGQFFVVTRVNGKSLPNSLVASRQASFNRGFDMRIATLQREVAAGPSHLDLTAGVAHAAPILDLVSAARGRLYGVSGSIDVVLEAGHTYRVNGVLDELRNEVWVEDEATHAIVATKVVGAPSDEARRVAAAPARYICCNLRRDDDWLGDASELDLPFVPLGTPVRVYDFKKDRAKASVDGKPMRIGIDEGAKHHTVQQLVDKFAVAEDPALALATWPVPVQAAVRAGRVAVGMTRPQVLMAIGYPRIDATPDLEAPTWRYNAGDEQALTVGWGADGRVDNVEAPAALKARLVATD